jgi:addiction module HigA family antidote
LIQSFSCQHTQELYETGKSEAFSHLGESAQRKLQQLDCATSLSSLQAPLSNQFDMAKTSSCKYSIHVKDDYRLYFFWREDNPTHAVITTCSDPRVDMMQNNLPLTHPGEILREDYLLPLGMSCADLAKALHVTTERVEALVSESCPLDPEMALRLTHYFGGDPLSWLTLQHSYDLKRVELALLPTILDTIQPYSE